MSKELLKQATVKVTINQAGNPILSGSGVIATNKDGKYFIITAEHCINGKRSKRLENITAKEITIEHKNRNSDSFVVLEVLAIEHLDEKQDIAVLSIAPLPDYDDKIVYSKLDSLSDANTVHFRGYPKWLSANDEAKTFDCKMEEVDQETFFIKSDEIKDSSLQQSVIETASGLSGSGVFEYYNEKIYLIGIVTELRVPNGTFGHIKCAKLDSAFAKYNFEVCPLSDKEQLKAVPIEAEDKVNFIGEIILDEHYIERNLSEIINKELDYFPQEKEKSTLFKIVNAHRNLFVLGNPGGGKTTELKNLALLNWKEGESKDYVPIFKSLKNFANTSTLEDYLPANWSKLNKILLILDGIDEISDIESFKSKLENFIHSNLSKKDIKFVISCRTNIYESVVYGLTNFSTFYLQDLTKQEGIELLSKKGVNFEYDSKWDVFLKTPFLVSILAEHISENGHAPISTLALWKSYIDKRLSHDKKDKLVKIAIDPMLIHKYSKKTSLVSELMKQNIIDENSLFLILKENTADFREFKKNPLLEKLEGQDIWFFEHRNIQEYFAAKALSELSIKKIKKTIIVKGTKKTHPTLFNTITFLINILEGDKFADLVDWLIKGEPELLFKADSDRAENFKVEVFKNYFKSECIVKNLWIGTNKSYTIKDIAAFADCKENFDFLVEKINDEKSHIRAVLSAFKLLFHFKIPAGREEEIKKWCIELLKNSELKAEIKSHIIQFITIQNLILNDHKFLMSIFELFKEETNKEINSSLLFMIKDLEDFEPLHWYIRDEFLRANKIVERKIKDDVHRGNSWVLNEIILKIADSDFFQELIKYHFLDGFRIDLDNSHAVKILEKCIVFASLEQDFIERLLKLINGKTNYYFQDRLLTEIITKSDSQYKATDYLLKNDKFSTIRVLLAKIATKETIELISNHISSLESDAYDIDVFRNNLWAYNTDMSYEFDRMMQCSGFKFESPLLSKDALAKKQADDNMGHQSNFDILFAKEDLLNQIRVIFHENSATIDGSALRKIENDWFTKNGYWNNNSSASLKMLHTLIYHYKSALTFEDVETLLADDFIRYDQIKNLITANVNSNVRFSVSEKQISAIIEWCSEAAKSINFDSIIKLGSTDFSSFSFLPHYHILKTILIFQDLYSFDLPQDFLLNCLEYFEIEKADDKDAFQKLFSKIGDRELFNQRIVYNIINRKMFSEIMDRHVDYALDHKLMPALPNIRNYFIASNPGYNLDSKLEKYIALKEDIELLKKCCKDVLSPKCWSAIKVLLKLGKEDDFCISKAVEYLELGPDDRNTFYLWDALSVLFQLNRKEAIVYYYSFLDIDHMSRLYFSNYSAVDYDTFEKIFFKTYGKDSQKSVFNNSGEFMNFYISNLSKDDESYAKTQTVLNSIKNKLNKDEQDSELFYINILIDNAETSHINSKSKPMNFEQALRKVEEIIN